MSDLKVGQFFHLSEFRSPNGEGIPRRTHHEIRQLCSLYLDPLRREFGVVTVTSGHRPQKYNDTHGGAPESQHVYGSWGYGVAADVRAARGRPSDWYRFLDSLGAGGLGRYDTHVHVDNRPGRARW